MAKKWGTARKPISDDSKWEDNVLKLEPELYMKDKPTLVRIMGGIFVAGAHWLTSKNNKPFLLGCPSFNPHTEETDLLHCAECWAAFERGDAPRPYHSAKFFVYDDNNQLIEDYNLWRVRPAGDTLLCPIHNIPMQRVECELCDINSELHKAKVDFKERRVSRVSARYIFNLLSRELQQKNNENPVRLLDIADKTMTQMDELTTFNGGNSPADPDKGCDFWLKYDKKARIWTTQKADQVALTEEERKLPLWDVDKYYRAATPRQIEQAIRVHNLHGNGASAPANRSMNMATAAPPPSSSMTAAPPPTATTTSTVPSEGASPPTSNESEGAPPSEDTPDCLGQWGSKTVCIRCASRQECVEKFQAQ